MTAVERYCGYCGTQLSAEGGEVNSRRRPKGWNTPVDMTGRQFGSLVVLEMVPGVTPRKWRCHCLNCGGFAAVSGDALRRGLTKRCGKCRYKREGQNATV